MNLRSFANHTVDLDLLPEASVVLDVGCRGWDFTNEVLSVRPGAWVIGFDPDTKLWPQNPPQGCEFINFALVGEANQLVSRYASYSTGEGNFLTDLDAYYDAKMVMVSCTNISTFMKGRQLMYFDVVKLDCEGSEFGILENWPGPIATQISVEFHDSGYTPGYGPDYDYGPMFERLKGFGYKIVQHELSKQGDGTGHFDSLLVLT